MTQKTKDQALQMGNRLRRIYPQAPMSHMPQALKRRDMWIDVLLYYAATGDWPGICYQDESADEARRWIVGEESPLDGYETAHTGPKQTGEKT